MCPTPEELQQWLVRKRKQALAVLNKDQLFGMFLHEMNKNRQNIQHRIPPEIHTRHTSLS